MIANFSGGMAGSLSVVFTEMAVQGVEERLFPLSKNRSPRIHKKLLKRHGGEVVRKLQPTMLLFDGTLYVHPALRADMESRLTRHSTARSGCSDN